MIDEISVSYIWIHASQGLGKCDLFSCVEVPNEDGLEKILEAIDAEPRLRRTYARVSVTKEVTDERLAWGYDGEEIPTVVQIEKCGNPLYHREDKPQIERAAVWVRRRGEWVGVRVTRTYVYEGPNQGIDQNLSIEGPFKLTEGWGKKILEAYQSTKSLEPKDVLHTDPSQLR